MMMKDSRGNKTVTLTLLVVSWIAITTKFMLGVDDGFFAPMSGVEYAAAMSPFLALFGRREFEIRKGESNV